MCICRGSLHKVASIRARKALSAQGVGRTFPCPLQDPLQALLQTRYKPFTSPNLLQASYTPLASPFRSHYKKWSCGRACPYPHIHTSASAIASSICFCSARVGLRTNSRGAQHNTHNTHSTHSTAQHSTAQQSTPNYGLVSYHSCDNF